MVIVIDCVVLVMGSAGGIDYKFLGQFEPCLWPLHFYR